MLTIYFNECGRFIENKLSLESFLPPLKDSISHNFKVRIRNYYKWRRLSTKSSPRIIDGVIHVNEISHLREMIPVYECLKENYKVYFITNNLNTLSFIKSKSLPYINLYSLNSLVDNEIFYSTKALRKDYVESLESIKNFDGKEPIRKFLNRKFQIYCNQNKWYDKLIKSHSPKFVFVANDLTSEGRLFTVICKKNNVPSFSIQHGNIYADWISRFHIVDTFFTHGKLATNILKKNNHFKTNIIASGSPFVYNLMSQKDLIYSASHQLRNKYSLPKSYILIALSGHGYLTSKKNYDKCLRAINHLIDIKKSDYFVIKLHKKENPQDYNFISGKPNVKIVYENSSSLNLQLSIYPWIINSTMLITGSSTSAVEAMLMNKPVISIDFNQEYRDVDFVKNGASINVNSNDDLIKSFDSIDELHIVKMESSNNIVKDYFGDLKKDSSKIIANHIDSIYAAPR